MRAPARLRHALEISPLRALDARLRRREARVVPYRGARLRLRGRVDGGGRLQVGVRWPDDYFARTELIVASGGRCTVDGLFRVFSGGKVIVAPGARLRLSDGGAMNGGARIECASDISIGLDAAIGRDVVLMDSDFHGLSGAAGATTRPIRIGDHVWIGRGATILRGVTIGDGAVIAAGAVVTRDVEPGALAAGVPARFVRSVTWAMEESSPESPAADGGGGRRQASEMSSTGLTVAPEAESANASLICSNG